MSGWEHVSGLRPTFEAGEEVNIFARAVCITTTSLVDGVGTMLSVLPPNSLLPAAANDCCVRLQQFDRNARVGPSGEFVVHLSCSATLTAQSQDEVAARQLELQEFLKASVRLLFDVETCTEAVNQSGDVATSATTAATAVPPPQLAGDSSSSKPELVWCLFFSKTVRTAPPPANLPKNVFVVDETHWGDLDFDGATAQAQKIFETIFPGEPFLPALPDPDAVQDEAALLLVRRLLQHAFARYCRLHAAARTCSKPFRFSLCYLATYLTSACPISHRRKLRERVWISRTEKSA